MFNNQIVRAIGDNRIEGYALVWHNPKDPGTEYNIYQNVYERINRDAVLGLTDREGILFSYNHNTEHPEGLTPDNLKLTVDDVGVKYNVELFDSPSSRVLMRKIQAGKVKGSSFIGQLAPGGITWSREGNKEIRTINKLSDLVEVSAVDNPAYQATQATVRSIEQERQEWIETERRIYQARQLLKIQV